jgi:hypothetical protein
LPGCKLDILPQRVKPHGNDRVDGTFSMGQRAAEPQASVVTGLLRGPSARSLFLFKQREMRGEFSSKIVIEVCATENIPEPSEW